MATLGGCGFDRLNGLSSHPEEAGVLPDTPDAAVAEDAPSEPATDARPEASSEVGPEEPADEPPVSGEDAASDASSCADPQQIDAEAEIACGGPCTPKCELGKTCAGNDNCQSGACLAGVCVECIVPETCPGGDGECRRRTCEGNKCGTSDALFATRVAVQVMGDCKARICDGAGNVIIAYDDADLPFDGKECTQDLCAGGTPSNPPVIAGKACTQGSGRMCDGSGSCVACNAPADCPGHDTECRTRTCDGHACGAIDAPATKAILAQTAGDCHVTRCDGSGGIAPPAVDDTDVPVDSRECTQNLCQDGTPLNPAMPASTPCGGANHCRGIVCGECDIPGDCPGEDGACHHRTCEKHRCGVFYDPPLAASPTQVPGDCHVVRCDGSGGALAPEVDDTDLPADGNDCTADICTSGVPSNPIGAAGNACAQAQGGRCTAAGKCSATFMVVRVGDGIAPLGNVSAPTFLERRDLDTGTLLNTIALPTVAVGIHRPLTLQASTNRDGVLSLSANGRYATMLGYGVGPGVSGVASSSASAVNRIVARIDSKDQVDTSTVLLSAFSGNNSRSATSVDGSSFWVAGAGSSGGVHYIPFGATGGIRILDAPSSVRAAFIFGGQLYGSSGDAPFSGVFAIGSGLPTAAGATAILLRGMATTGQSPCSFLMFDRDATIPGLDTLYLTDDRSPASGGGIKRWTFDGSAWAPTATFNLDNAGIMLAVGMRGLAGMISGNAAILIATSADDPNRIFKYVDDGTSVNPKPTLLGTAASGTAYRGISMAP
jgi:hypothetical protein